MSKQQLTIKNLTIGYNDAITSHINCKIENGEFHLLLGANGTGKSTFIKTITQQIPPLSGSIILDGKPIKNYTKKELAKKIAIVSTATHFDQNITVFDLLALGRIPYLNLFGTLQPNDLQIISKYIEYLNLNKLKPKRFLTLSDGQKQKVLIARALIQDTPFIILDEPTAHLDVKNRVMVFSILEEIALRENKSIICATHEIDIALKYASKAIIIDKTNTVIVKNTKEIDTDSVYDLLF